MITSKQLRAGPAVAIVLGLVALLMVVAGAIVQAATVGPPQNVSNDPTNSLHPRTAQAPDGNLHVVWVDESASRQVRYSKGTWNGSTYVFAPSALVADVGSYQYSQPNLAVAPNGTILVAWSDGTLRFKTWSASASAPSGVVQTLSGGIQPSITADSSSRFHIVWNGDFKVQYCAWNGSACEKRDSFMSESPNRPDVAVDSSGGVHVVADSGQMVKYRGRAAGAEWGTVQDIGGGNFAQIAADGQGNVHIVRSSNFDIAYCQRTLATGCTALHTINAGDDLQPSIAATTSGNLSVVLRNSAQKKIMVTTREGGVWSTPREAGSGITPPDISQRPYSERASIVWSENYEIQHVLVSTAPPGPTPTPPPPPTPTPPPINGTLTIDNNAAYTRQAQVNVSITNTSAMSATNYSLGEDADPGTPTLPFTNPTLSRTFNLNVADGRCRVHTLFARISSGGSISPAFSDTIIYDPAATAIARAQNPNSALNYPLNAIGNALVPSGDVGYTREERFTMLIVAPEEECSGLKRYAIVAGGTPKPDSASPEWKDVPAEGYVSALIQFTANVGQGTYTFDVYVEDTVGNVSVTPIATTIVYDTAGPTVDGSTTDLPTASSPKGGRATITIGQHTVLDNLYPGSGADQQYWGYWVAVKQTAAGPPSDGEWDTSGVVVPGPVPSALLWNMAAGMVGPFQPGASYTVYVRLLDGAGNGSTPLTSQAVTVQQLEYFGFTPIVQR